MGRPRGAAIGPLQRVLVEHWMASTSKFERLACGHWIHAPQDIAGFTNAYRRRCYKCRKGLPADPEKFDAYRATR